VDHQTLHHKELVIMEIPPHARVAVTELFNGDTIHVAPSIIVNNTYRTVARPPDIDALEFTTPEGRWAEATTLTTDYSYCDHVEYLNTSHYEDPCYNDIHYYSTRNCDYSDNYKYYNYYYNYSDHYNLHYYNSIYNHYGDNYGNLHYNYD
jgi:hypothetical protein